MDEHWDIRRSLVLYCMQVMRGKEQRNMGAFYDGFHFHDFFHIQFTSLA